MNHIEKILNQEEDRCSLESRDIRKRPKKAEKLNWGMETKIVKETITIIIAEKSDHSRIENRPKEQTRRKLFCSGRAFPEWHGAARSKVE